MNRHNYFVRILRKINLFINSLLKKKLNKLNFLFEKDKLLTFLGFKRTFVFFLVLLFSIFSYLSIPYLYNSKKLLTNVKNQLLKNLDLDFNLSDNYSYNLFPKPNFTFENRLPLNQIESSNIYYSLAKLKLRILLLTK